MNGLGIFLFSKNVLLAGAAAKALAGMQLRK